MEFLERLGVEHDEERWLVRAPGAEAPHVVRFFAGEEASATHDATRKWVGPIHPRICAILGMQWSGDRLAVEVEDERGPRFVDAAAQLEDPVERERWAVAQVI